MNRRFPGCAALAVLVAFLGASCDTNEVTGPLPVISRVEVSPEADTVQVGSQAQFSAVAYDTLGNPVSAPLQWRTANPAVFTVSASGRVTGVAEGTAELWVTSGDKSDTAFVTVFPDTGWFLQLSGTTSELHGVFFLPDGRNGWAVGDGGTIVRTANAGATWARQTSNTGFTLNAAWFTSVTEGWAVGASGTILRTTNGGTVWTRLTNVGQGDVLEDVWFATPDTGWVVGGSGLVLRTFDRGASWQALRLPTAFTLNGVSFSGTRDGWAVGTGGVIAGTHDRGLSWFVVPSLTTQALRAVWRRTESAAFAAGSQGVAPRTVAGPDSTMWELRNAGPTRQLEGIHYPTDLIGYGVGFEAMLGGLVLRTDDAGVTWEAQASHTQNHLNDVFFVDALRGWAVGEVGTILHTARGGRR